MLKNQTWKIPQYSKSEINRAGDVIRNLAATQDEMDNAIIIVDNWRASHAYPLHVMYMHLRKLAKPNNALVVERLKRLDSIINKLRRTPGMELWRMQDLGGCRCILPTVDEVYSFARKYQKARIRHPKHDINEQPRGFESLHLRHQKATKRYSHKKL